MKKLIDKTKLLTKEDITLAFLKDPGELAQLIWDGRVPKSDEIETLICELGDYECAYTYAREVKLGTSDKLRRVSSRDPWYAYYYALLVDGAPHKVTRDGVSGDPVEELYKRRWENSRKGKIPLTP